MGECLKKISILLKIPLKNRPVDNFEEKTKGVNERICLSSVLMLARSFDVRSNAEENEQTTSELFDCCDVPMIFLQPLHIF